MAVKCATYGRVSTKDQSHDMQTSEFVRYISAREFELVAAYTDIASGSRENRKGLQQLMSDARLRKFDVVIVWKWDRFARSMRHLVDALAEFQSLGIDFISIREGTDTTTPHGKLLFGIFASVAEFERSLIRERTISGLRHAASKGRFGGRPFVVGDRGKVREMRAAGGSLRKIAAETGFKIGTVRNIIKGMKSGTIDTPTVSSAQLCS